MNVQGNKKSLDGADTEASVRKQTLPPEDTEASVRKQTLPPEDTEASVRKQTLPPEDAEASVRKQTLPPEDTEASVRKQTLPPEDAEASVRKQTLPPEDAEASVKKQTLPPDEANSTVSRQTLQPISSNRVHKIQAELDAHEELYLNSVVGDGYHVKERIDGAGQATIFKAQKGRAKKNAYAVKIYARSNEIDEEVLKRIKTIDSPHVAKVYEYGRTDNGDLYVVMDFYENGAVAENIDRVSLPDNMIVNSYVGQLNEAIHAIHEAGLYHCDIKPDNIVYADKNKERLVVLDFGIAVPFDKNENSDYPDALMRERPATLEYSAPEVEGTGISTISDRSDYFSLGVTLLVMGSHRNIFTRDDAKETRRKLVAGDYPIESTVDGRLAALIVRLIEVNRQRRIRYQDVKRWVENPMTYGIYSAEKHRCLVELDKKTVVADRECYTMEAYVEALGTFWQRGFAIYSAGGIEDVLREVSAEATSSLLNIRKRYALKNKSDPYQGFALALLTLDKDAALYYKDLTFKSFLSYVERINEHLDSDMDLDSIPFSPELIKTFAENARNPRVQEKGIRFIELLGGAPQKNQKELLGNFFYDNSGKKENRFFLDGVRYTDFKQITKLLFDEKGEPKECESIFNPAFCFYLCDRYSPDDSEGVVKLRAIFDEKNSFVRNILLSISLSGEVDITYKGIPLHTFNRGERSFLPFLRAAYESGENKEIVAEVLRSGILSDIIEVYPGYLMGEEILSHLKQLEDSQAATDKVIYMAYHKICAHSCFKYKRQEDGAVETVHDVKELAKIVGKSQSNVCTLPFLLYESEEFRLWCQTNGYGDMLQLIDSKYDKTAMSKSSPVDEGRNNDKTESSKASTSIFYVDVGKCIGCGACIRKCSAGAIQRLPKKDYPHARLAPVGINSDLCTGCGDCITKNICLFKAIIKGNSPKN